MNVKMNIRYKKRIRLKDFDYKGSYQYFITLCAFNKKPIFKEVNVGQGFSPASSRPNSLPYEKIGKPEGLPYEKYASLNACPTVKWFIKVLKEKSEIFGFKVWVYCFMPDQH